MRRCSGGVFLRWVTTVLACLVAIISAEAQPPQPTPGDVDLESSRVYVFVGKSGLGHDHAVIGSLRSGRIRLGARDQAGTLVFDMRSFRADTPEARRVLKLSGETDPGTQRQVNDNMLGPAVLDAARHPTATLELRSALPSSQPAANGRQSYDLEGQFTLHGVTKPVAIRVDAEPVDGIVRLSGGFTIKQTDFGMKPFSKLGGVVGVSDALKIYGDIRVVALPAVAPAPPPSPLATQPR